MEYIQEMREILHNLQNRIQKAKQNIEGITQAMQVSELSRAGRGCQAEASRRCSSVIGGQRTPPPSALDCDVSKLPEQKKPFHSAEPTPLQSVTVSRLRGALAVPGLTPGISWGKRWAEHS